MKEDVMFAKFAPGQRISVDEYILFSEMKRRVTQDVLEGRNIP